MNVWDFLNSQVSARQAAVVVTLLNALESAAGLMAVVPSPGGAASGPLTQAPFWADDWAAALGAATACFPPAEGLLVENAGRRYYVSALSFERSALVLGAGHVGAALCRQLRFLEFEVSLMDDRPDFLIAPEENVKTTEDSFERLTDFFAASSFDAVIIVTRGHAQDTACLRQILNWPDLPPYLGMIGSRRRVAETMRMLASEGCGQARLAHVHAPVGLKIKAQTPAEIAVSIAAEIIMTLAKPVNQNQV